MTIKDEIATKLQHEKANLLRAKDRGEIVVKEGENVEEVFQKEYNRLEKEIRERNELVIKQVTEERKKEDEVEKEKVKMSDELNKDKVKVGRKPVKESYATQIEKALRMKTVKSLEDVVEKVTEWKPGKDSAALTRMTKVIINEVKKQKQPRWLGYTWNEEEFLLTGKE